MRRRIVIASVIGLILAALVLQAVPAFAAGTGGATQPPAQGAQQANKMKVIARLLLVQDEAKVDAFIAKAKSAGKISAAQATELKAFWTAHHKEFTKRAVLARLLGAKDGAKVQAFLDKAVAAGKIQKEQAAKIMSLWKELHSK